MFFFRSQRPRSVSFIFFFTKLWNNKKKIVKHRFSKEDSKESHTHTHTPRGPICQEGLTVMPSSARERPQGQEAANRCLDALVEL